MPVLYQISFCKLFLLLGETGFITGSGEQCSSDHPELAEFQIDTKTLEISTGIDSLLGISWNIHSLCSQTCTV